MLRRSCSSESHSPRHAVTTYESVPVISARPRWSAVGVSYRRQLPRIALQFIPSPSNCTHEAPLRRPDQIGTTPRFAACSMRRSARALAALSVAWVTSRVRSKTVGSPAPPVHCTGRRSMIGSDLRQTVSSSSTAQARPGLKRTASAAQRQLRQSIRGVRIQGCAAEPHPIRWLAQIRSLHSSPNPKRRPCHERPSTRSRNQPSPALVNRPEISATTPHRKSAS